MKVVEQFKRRILDLAIHGKLVPQDPNDEPASELLARIKAEKEKQIKAGKIKKGKSSTVGSDGAAYEKFVEQAPFEIPKGWAWAQLDELFRFVDYRGKTPHKVSKGIPLITAKNVRQGFIDYSVCEFISKEEFSQRRSRGVSHQGDILFTTEAPLGYIAIADLDVFSTGQRLITLQRHGDTDNHCMMYFMQSTFWQSCLYSKKTGTTVAGIKAEYLKEMFLPVPPLIEQKRIVARIGELFRIADSLGEAADGLEAAAKRLDKKILDLAIRGKLLPQNPTDEPASELLKRIAATSHKSPCKNHETPIEPPFAIPESWEWAKLGEIISLLSGRDLSPSDYSSFVNQFPYITGASNFVDGRLVVNRWTDKAITISHNGDLLITCKGTIGAMAINNIGDIHIARQIMAISSSGMDLKFIKIFLESAISTLKDSATSMIPGIDRNTVLNLLIPVPPLSEQKRIVTRVQGARDILALLFP